MRKFTAVKCVEKYDENGVHTGEWWPEKTITCELTGVTEHGSNVWTEIETGEQYYLSRMCGHYSFYHI